jgi:KUP system potassium uptake protein
MDAASKAGAERESAKKSAHPPGHKAEGGHPHAQSFLALTALGVVFGDIGTSPLYTFSTALTATGQAPGPTQILGVVSLTFWALMVLISLKYVTIVLRADNDGEGGILVLLSLVEQHGHTAERVKLSLVVVLGVIGAALLYGDGVITPAISVLSAIEGLKFSPAAANFVVPATLVILIGLFALQYRGTGSVGRLFGPVMVVWFVAIGVLGAINIWSAPEILAALNPLAAVRFAMESPLTLFIVLGGVFLALTGGEALYADMGHVSSRAIRQAWFGLVFPALILSYFGQGARVLVDPKAIENPFYSQAPGWALIPMVLLATLATIIASHALISGVFSMTRQAIQMGLSPRSEIVPTSSDEAGQVYLPTANWLLMIGTLLVVVIFRSSDALASAYGIAVSGTMLCTTLLLLAV